MTVLELPEIATKYSFEYTVMEGLLQGNTYVVGHWWDDMEDAVDAAEDFTEMALNHNCYVNTEMRTRHSIGF